MSQSAAGRRWMRWTVSGCSSSTRQAGSLVNRVVAANQAFLPELRGSSRDTIAKPGGGSPRGQGSYRVDADPVRRADQRRRATAHQIASARAKGQERMNTA